MGRSWTCLLFRKRATKPPTGVLTARAFFPWRHVMVDFEGPSSPASASGNRYVLEYVCMVTMGRHL